MANVLLRIAAKLLPRSFKDFIKYLRRTPQRLRVRRKRAAGSIVTKEDIVKGLRSLGIKSGDVLDLESLGYTKLLGRGTISKPFLVRVPSFSKHALKKLEAVGGKIIE